MSPPQSEKSTDTVPPIAPGHDSSTETSAAFLSPPSADPGTLAPPVENAVETADLAPSSTPIDASPTLDAPAPAPTIDWAVEASTLAPSSVPTGSFPTLVVEATRVDLAAGILGPYREMRPLKAWKSGTIYSAIHPRLQRQVELQVLEEECPDQESGPNPVTRDAFLQMARRAAAIRHPNVETGLLEAATYADVSFVVRERSKSGPLEGYGPRNRSQRRREPLYPNRSLAQALLEAARGLVEIHRTGMHHGHITPEVLRRGSHGQICLAGLELEPAKPNQVRPTPEAILGDPVQHDLFDLGWSFAELICGRVPAMGETPGNLADRLRRLNPGLSRALAGILERCLTVSGRKFGDAQELVHAVEPQTKIETVPAGLYTRLWTQLPDALILCLPAFAAVMSLFGTGILQPNGFPLLLNGFAAGLVMYLIWEPLVGWTPGRRLRGLRLLDAAGERPPRWRLLVRCLFRLAWVFVVVYVMELLIAELLRLVGSEQHALLEKILKAFVGFGMIAVFPLLAAAVLYWTSRWTPDGRPVHDYLTGISWYQHRAKREEHILEAVDVDRRRLPAKPGLTTTNSSVTGKVLGQMDQYELRGLIGQGGMGAVYEALDTLLERRVAIKVLSSSISATSTVLQRFEREARLAAQLSHPNVAQVYGVGEAASQPYMVMEFVDGEDLQKHVQREGPLPLARAWDYVKQTALALREAANHGIVHRDIKPANLILAGNDIVKVTDFGISRAFGDEEDNPGSAAAAFSRLADASLTSTGALLGTPQYFSPEQARAEKLDSRSDIYSLGITLYFLVRGRPPFEGSDLLDLVMRQCNEEPPPLLGIVPGWTPERDDLLQRMIAKDRASRFQDYDELLRRLESTAPRPPTLAGLGRRACAELANLLLAVCFSWGPALPGMVLFRGQATEQGLSAFLNQMLFCAIYVFGIGRWGTTPGKWLLHLKVIRPGSPQVGYGRAFVRVLTLYPVILGTALWSLRTLGGGKDSDSNEPWFVLTITLLLVNCCLILFSARRRGLHDLAAGTLVIRLPDEHGRWGRLFKSLSFRRRLHL